MERAIQDLCQLQDDRLFEEVSTGVGHIIEVVNRLDAAALTLSEAGQEHPARILGNLAEEEAAKVLILVDVVRCPQAQSKERNRLLGYFYNHLAKGIYAEVCSWHVMDFAELKRYVDINCEPYYLDGPNEVDWIFYNPILQRREDKIYVNYVREGREDGEHGWVCPRNEELPLLRYRTREVIQLARALYRVGVTAPEGLIVVAEVWRSVEVTPEFGNERLAQLNSQTLDKLEKRGVPREARDDDYTCVRERWPFPLYPLVIPTPNYGWRQGERKRLREVQRTWAPDI